MLEQLHIENFAIIENLDLDLSTGMTVITGDTGAGKSIVIDALDLALGHRADVQMIRQGATRCEISARFDVRHCAKALYWLQAHELEDDYSCIIRRVINQDGRSKNYINGHAVTLQQIRELAQELIQIHAQHEHYALLKKEEQRELLDRFADHPLLRKAVQTRYQAWRDTYIQWQTLLKNNDDQGKMNLLQYQLQELQSLNLQEHELEHLHQEQKKLSHGQEILGSLNEAHRLLYEEDNSACLNIIARAQRLLTPQCLLMPELKNTLDLLENAALHLQEAGHELSERLSQINIDPERLIEVETRLKNIHHLARKLQITAEQLPEFMQKISVELNDLEHSDEKRQELQKQTEEKLQLYQKAALALSLSRKKAALSLNEQMTLYLRQLSLPQGQFQVVFGEDLAEPSAFGQDHLEFHIQANVGQALLPLAKIASGGELSRASLALQLITARQDNTPSLIFDEVDVGIGGATADIVGQLLRQLGEKTQVICITHQASVAARGHHHLRIEKEHAANRTISRLLALDHEQRIGEIARMLGGQSKTAKAHAQELLALA